MKNLINTIIYEDDYEIVRLKDKDTIGITFKNLYSDEETTIALEQYFAFYDGEPKCNDEVKEKINELIK